MRLLHLAVLPQRLVLLLRVVLVLCALALAGLMVVAVPAMVVSFWSDDAEHAHLWGPLLAIFFLGLAAVEVIIFCTWKLVTLVQQDRIFSDSATPWVNGIVRAMAAGWVLLACTAPYCYWFAEVDDAPGVLLVGMVMGLVATAFLLLMLVLRELLRRATTLRSELEGVI
jgi:hypothetical protein